MKTRLEILDELRLVLDEVGCDLSPPEEANLLYEDLGLESIDILDLVFRTERQFGIRFARTEIEKFVSVADVVNLVESKLKGE